MLRRLLVSCFVLAPLAAQCALVVPTAGALGFTGIDQTWVITLPFAFPFGGTTTTAVTVASNGFVWLGAQTLGARPGSPTPTAFANDPPSLAILWTPLVPGTPGGTNVYVETIGSDTYLTWWQVKEPNGSQTFNLQLRLSVTGEITYWYDPELTLQNRALVGISHGNGQPLLTAQYDGGLPFVAGPSQSFHQVFPPGGTPLAGQALHHVPTGVDSFVALDAGCRPWPVDAAAFVFDRTDAMGVLQSGTTVTRADSAQTAAAADLAAFFATNPAGRVVLFEFGNFEVSQLGGPGTSFGNAVAATAALAGLSPLAPGRPLAAALCAATDELLVQSAAAAPWRRKLYLYSAGGDDESDPMSCRGTAADAATGNRCAQMPADANHPTAFSAGSWQELVCGLLHAKVELHAYYWDDFADQASARELLDALAAMTGGSLYRTWSQNGAPAARAWRLRGDGCHDGLGTRLAMTCSGLPRPGETLAIGCRTSQLLPFVLGVGLSDQAIGSTPLPLALDAYGAPGCRLYTSWEVTDAFVGWHGERLLTLPPGAWLLGLPLHWQALAMHPASNSLGVATSNLLSMTVVP